MSDWHLAASLAALRTEINRRWPNRDKTSDGSIGDASHQARKSDHNPDWDAGGVVRAIDVDKDGIDVQQLLDATIGDQRVWYVIWDHHIYSRTYGWEKRVYDGTNPHDHHIHISIRHTGAAERDTSPWFVTKPATPTPNVDKPITEEDDMPWTKQQLEEFAGVGVHGQKLGRSSVTIGQAIDTTRKDAAAARAMLASLSVQVTGLTAAVKALSEQKGVDPAAVIAAVSGAAEKALQDVKITLAVEDDEKEPTQA